MNKPVKKYAFHSGDIFLTRNTGEIGNANPGYWNHAAILYSPEGWVIEAQDNPINQVFAVPLTNFWERYPEILVLRSHFDIGNSLAYHAKQLVGNRYKKLASFGPRWNKKDGDNCVSVIRKCYYHATGRDLRLRQPDDIAERDFIRVFHKKEYDAWTNPENRYAGAVFKKTEIR